MSNKCEAPRDVDALGAGGNGINQFWGSVKNYSTMVAPFFVWYYVIPAITGLLFEKQMMQVEQEKVREATAEEEAGTYSMMVEVEAPISWIEYFTKLILFGGLLFLMLLLSIYFSQEGLLYVPD